MLKEGTSSLRHLNRILLYLLLTYLDLQDDLHSLKRRHHGLGDGRRDAAGHEIQDKVLVHVFCKRKNNYQIKNESNVRNLS